MILKRRIDVWIFVLVILIGVIGVSIIAQTFPVSATKDKRPCVIIDAGHGGFDGGAVAEDGTVEKDINLSISLKVAKILEFSGYRVILTRTTDDGTEDDNSQKISQRKKSDLENRLKLMEENTDAIYVSVHLNKFTTTSAKGTQVFYTPNFDTAKDLGQSIQNSIVSLLQPENERVIKKGTDSTYILKNAKVPTVIVECGFLSNKTDLENLKREEYQSQMAYAISKGIIDYINVQK